MFRPRKLRTSPAMLRMVAETRLHAADFVLPVFVKEGITEPEPVLTMPGVFQHSLSSLTEVVATALSAKISGIMIFGIPLEKDAIGSQASNSNGILAQAVRVAKEASNGELLVMADLCLDEFTDHGHCGVLTQPGSNTVDNDATLLRYQEMAVALAEAGADVLGLSGMMDGQVAAVSAALVEANQYETAILGYCAKYASSFYGPFRDAVDSSFTGNRNNYQMNPANSREGVLEAKLDLAEGADIIMVKPALGYLDVLHQVAKISPVPVAAYQVSGEYSMIELAAKEGIFDRKQAILVAILAKITIR